MPVGVYKRTEKSKNAKGKHWKITDTSNMKGKHNGVEFKKGHLTWNIGKKCPQLANENNPQWKGDDVGYLALHAWFNRKLGKPKMCDNCLDDNSKRIYDRASISRKCKRNLDDWISLCRSCHRKYDLNRLTLKELKQIVCKQ